MKKIKIFALAAFAMAGMAIASCSDANEYEDWNASNPSWVENWNDTIAVAHPDSLTGTTWSRAAGVKVNAYGEDIQGFVESIDFVTADSCAVKMSEPTLPASWSNNTTITWTDDSNTESLPLYNYTYSEVTGKVEIIKKEMNDKGKVSDKILFTGMATRGSKTVLTVAHYGDVPQFTYLMQ